MEFFGIITLGIILALSNMGGIGGGGAVVPLCMTFFGFGTRESISISGLSIFLSALVRYIY